MKNLIMKIKETLKECKAIFVTQFKAQFSKSTGYGIDVIQNDILLHANGFVFAACYEYEDDTHKIFVDRYFMEAPVNCRKFIIWHELGHIGNSSKGKRTLECEFKADAYAASKIGKRNAINALRYMWAKLVNIDITACGDIPSRLKELGANVDDMWIKLKDGTVLREPDLRELLKEVKMEVKNND